MTYLEIVETHRIQPKSGSRVQKTDARERSHVTTFRAGMQQLMAVVALLTLASCMSAPKPDIINLSALKPLPAQAASDIVPLRVSVAAVVSPQGTADSYRPLLDYLAEKLDRPVELVQRRTYGETNELVRTGAVDLAFVCTSAYITGHDEFGMTLLVAPEVEGSSVYSSLLIVPIDSPVQSMRELHGAVFAFTDPISNTGRVYPTYLVQQFGTTPAEFFSRTFFTYSHDDAIRAVASGMADGAAVDSMVYEFALLRNPLLANKVKVIHESPPFGIPPVVISPNTRPQQRAMLQEILLGMRADPDAQPALQALDIDGFVAIDDSAYDTAREITHAVGPLTP